MLVYHAGSGDSTIVGQDSRIARARNFLRRAVADASKYLLKTENPSLHSPAILRSDFMPRIAAFDADVVHLNWINHEMLSIEDIGRIDRPLIWTIHDMWAFCGAEHYTSDFRWQAGYLPRNRPAYESGIDLNRWVWERKRRVWNRPMHVVAPSAWLAECVEKSALMKGWPCSIIPNPIDTDFWSPVDRGAARESLNLPPHAPLLLFGAHGGLFSAIKGFDLLLRALRTARDNVPDLQLALFGRAESGDELACGLKVHRLGHIEDDAVLRMIYSAADIVAVPSRQEAFGQVASEALACGTPVLAFRSGGPADIVEHKRNGYLARPFDTDDLAHGIEWMLADKERSDSLIGHARNSAVARFSYPIVARRYQELYHQVLTTQ